MRAMIRLTGFSVFLGLAAPLALAEAPRDEVRVEFAYSADEPADELYARMRISVKNACRINGEAGLSPLRRENLCRADLLSGLVEEIARVDIAAVHLARTGEQVPATGRNLANEPSSKANDQTG